MNDRDLIENNYFNWLKNKVAKDKFSSKISFDKLLFRLHCVPFKWTIERDENRANDGIALRWRYACDDENRSYEERMRIDDLLSSNPCSILEMMIALAIRCEEQIMDNPKYGDRTGQWFWGMIISLGLGNMDNRNFDIKYVNDILENFIHHRYDPTGKGGLFTVRDTRYDMRRMEIWRQLCLYLDNIG